MTSPNPQEGGKHTPGEWRVGQLASYDAITGRPCRFVYRGDGESTETRIRINGGEGEDGAQFDCDADARLIAAAPALLEALKDARETILHLKNARWSECEGSDEEWTAEIDAALLQATGGDNGR